MSTLGQRLRKAREKKGWSQTFVCEKLKISNSRLSGYERDYREPDSDMLAVLADLYEVSIDYLITGKEKKNDRNFKLDEITEKDEKDIAKRMEKIRKDLASADGLSFHGEPMSEEAIESLLEAIEYAERQTVRINKKYIPKKYRRETDN